MSLWGNHYWNMRNMEYVYGCAHIYVCVCILFLLLGYKEAYCLLFLIILIYFIFNL